MIRAAVQQAAPLASIALLLGVIDHLGATHRRPMNRATVDR
jgi:hypothetical protein